MSHQDDKALARRDAAIRLGKLHPALFSAFGQLDQAQGATGALDEKTRELIAIAVAVTTRCDGCIGTHAAAAARAGATQEEVAEALATAIALNAGAAFTHSIRTFEAFSAALPA